ncbi:rRNA maturation RNase YbeY [Pelagibacteraceae bacterium]|jgi:probable rRNA maturation factor|nr:rRNA maturation RNase YbeY [Pelagibacteraceae bacterium]
MIKVNVEVDNKSWHTKIENPKLYLNKKLGKISKNIKFFRKKKLIFTILLTNSLKLKKLNKKFRNKNKATDVLSFPFIELNSLKLINKKNFYIGDIAISYEIINNRAKKNNFYKEFDKTWIHGFLHLIGYDHIKNKDYILMSKLEKKITNSIN